MTGRRNVPRTLIPAGTMFGLWTTCEGTQRSKDRPMCRCSCGIERRVYVSSLTAGESTYCGKYGRHPGRRTNATKHGHYRNRRATKEYDVWRRVKGRCLNPRNANYADYGGRGIGLAPEWAASFNAFLAAVGQAPSPQHTIERIDNGRGYVPGNVRWATWHEQHRNKRSNVWLELDGVRKCRADWARERGLTVTALRTRLASGWTVERALTTPMTVRRTA